MKTRNLVIGVLAVLLVGSLIWCYTSNKTAIDDKVVSTTENVKNSISGLNESIEKTAETNYALIKAKVALLKSKNALGIDKSEQKSNAELDNAVNYLSEAEVTADPETKTKIDLLKTKINSAKESVVEKKDDALDKISAAIDEVKSMIEEHNDKIQTEKKKKGES